MAKKEKSESEKRLDLLMGRHGEFWLKMSEIECKIMRLEGKIKNASGRGMADPYSEWVIQNLYTKLKRLAEDQVVLRLLILKEGGSELAAGPVVGVGGQTSFDLTGLVS